ncbi:MAG: sodium:solute symporter family protein [Phycisphaerae bacterium]|nr:sodium:solute symporter family protein [Phycisphaerae bacterium]
MILAQTVGAIDVVVVLVYLFSVGYLGWLGYRRTKTATDYMIAGRAVHPFVMAMSYGATFISTSAIVGFGGVAGLFGMSLLWLVFLNIFVGIFVAFVCLGGPTRRMGHRLDAHTFPELLGRRYQSTFIQVFAGLVIFLFIPLYAAAVLIGGCEFISTQFGIDYTVALLVFSVIIAAYVVVGGLKGVMYTDALQGTIMLVGMVILLLFTYGKVGGVTTGHRELTELADLVPGTLKAIGHRGWTAFPVFGFGDKGYDLWWISVSTIILGVGIGVLAQPQLIVRFMTVRSQMQLNRAVLIGGIFILGVPGVVYVVGSLTNAYFVRHGPIFEGRVAQRINPDKGHVLLQLMKPNEAGAWRDVVDDKGKLKIVPAVLDPDQPYLTEARGEDGKPVEIARGRSISIVYAKGNPDQIIPTYLTLAMPKWFGLLFLLTLLAAAMSTLSSQFHALGTSIGRDVYEQLLTRPKRADSTRTMHVVRIAIVVGIILAVLISYHSRGGYIIARATAIFFGLCASTFLPAYVGGLFFRRSTRAGAIASMLVGFVVTGFWLLFIKAKEAGSIGLVQRFAGGKESLLADSPNWYVVDPIVVAMPLSIVVFVVVSLLTRPCDEEHLGRCFSRP